MRAAAAKTNPGMHVIEATAGIDAARAALSRPGVSWLAVCHEGVLVGTVDEDALRAANEDDCVGALTGGGRGVVRWLA